MFDYTIKTNGCTLIGSLPTGMMDLQSKLVSIGLWTSPDNVLLRYGEDEQIRARVTGTNEDYRRIAGLLTKDN